MEKCVFAEGLLLEMYQLWKDKELCDVSLSVEGEIILAHRIVLAALSPYFKAMFCSQLNEKQKFQIVIQDLNPQAAKIIVEFAYTANLDLTEDTVQVVMQTAIMMQIPAVEKLCSSFLVKNLHPSNCLGIRDFAQVMACFELKDTADKYCEENFSEVSQHEEFFKLEVEEVIGLVSRDSLKVAKEEEVYAAVMRWVAYDPERSKDDVSLLMEHVRLPLVQWDFLIKEVSKDKLFVTNEDCRQYLQQARAFQASSFHPDLINFAYNEAVARSQPRAFFSAADRLYLIGGESASREILSEFESFNPFTNQAKELLALPEAKRSLGAAIVGNIIYAIGGATISGSSRTVHAFDIDKQQWQSRGSLCEARSSVVVSVVGGGIIALGGHGSDGVLSTAEKYDVELNSWSLLDMLEARSMAAAAVIDFRLYLCGGYNGCEDLQSCHVLDTKVHQWSRRANMLEPRSLLGAAALGGRVYVAGGCNQDMCLSSVEMFNPSTNEWTIVRPMIGPRRGLGLTALGDMLFAAGGHDGKTLQRTILKYIPHTNEWSCAGNIITSRGSFRPLSLHTGSTISAPVSSYRSHKENLSTMHELHSTGEDPIVAAEGQSDKMASYVEMRLKQKCVIEFLREETVAPIDIHQGMLNIYGDQTVDVSTVRRWMAYFSSGKSDMKDKPHSGRSCTAVTPCNVCSCSLLEEMHSQGW